MNDQEYWNIRATTAGYRDWQSHPRIATMVNIVLGALSFLFGFAIQPADTAAFWSRIWLGIQALLIYGLIVLGLFLLWVALVVPVRQRDSARVRIAELGDELAQRDRIEFTLTTKVEETGTVQLERPHREFHGVKALWVEVTNRGRVAEFSARIPSVQLPVARLEDEFKPDTVQVYNVAWEQTLDWRQDLGVGRLRLASVATEPKPVFWFWTAENATFNPGSHGMGWRLRPLAEVIEFPLIVTNITDRKSITRTCQIRFGKGGELSFSLVDHSQEAISSST